MQMGGASAASRVLCSTNILSGQFFRYHPVSSQIQDSHLSYRDISPSLVPTTTIPVVAPRSAHTGWLGASRKIFVLGSLSFTDQNSSAYTVYFSPHNSPAWLALRFLPVVAIVVELFHDLDFHALLPIGGIML